MDRIKAQAYLDKTNWYVLRRSVTGEPVPPEIEKKRKEAYRVLQEIEERKRHQWN